MAVATMVASMAARKLPPRMPKVTRRRGEDRTRCKKDIRGSGTIDPMRTVHCVKLGRELPGLEEAPWPGPLGQRIYDSVSQEAWEMWEERMKMILNEYRLMPWQKEAQDIVAKHMEEFFFGEGAALPPGYVPQQAK